MVRSALASLTEDQRAAMRAGLRVLTPLKAGTPGAAGRTAYGAVALPLGAGPESTARLLVEHFHRAQLGGCSTCSTSPAATRVASGCCATRTDCFPSPGSSGMRNSRG
ncbi:hypothetical protein ACQP2K_31545 [Microbispora siamensis]